MIQDKSVCAIIVAAGKSTRMGFDKLFHPIAGAPVLRHAVARLAAHPAVDRLVVVAGENMDRVRALLEADSVGKPLAIVAGGDMRADSVLAGLAACEGADIVAIHDAARPFVPAEVLDAVFAATVATGAAAPALPVKDTMKRAAEGLIETTVPREGLWAVQTPQCFLREPFEAAFAAIPAGERAALTDDCQVFERAGLPVALVPGDERNRKITTPEDLAVMDNLMAPTLRVGHGYDVHKLVAGRPLILGGVAVPFEKGLLGHSDADVLLHAVSDALLGACALGDIGRHFPDTDPAYKGADSLVLLEKVGGILRENGFEPQNLDATLLCQRPKLAPHIPAMRANIAGALGIPEGAVSVKATTEEGLGFTGSGEGIAAHCVAMCAARRPGGAEN